MNGLANGAYGILEEGAVNGLQAGLDNGLANGLVNSDNSQINWQNIGAENWEKYRKQLIKFNQPIVNDTLFTSAVTVSALTNQYIGGVVMKDGRVYLVPANATSARIYDPYKDTITTPTGSFVANSQDFVGG